ncbi:syntaxin-8 [Dasypus novemcinctus]|uniref:syntaxin-8 n=1 Tax=Dasypus novemcinctus TaxID=9361 RepID=UPI0026602F5E|nr:syntaxin-8 [Dasypus novemcinctus]
MSRAGRRSQLQRAGSVRRAGGESTMAPDPWLSIYDSTCHIAQEIAEKIQQRNQYERNGESTTKLTVTIRPLLQNLKEKIALLKDLLLSAVSTHQITQLEGDRRQNLLDDLVTRERLLLASFKNEGTEPDLIRSSLMTGGAKRGVPNPWLLEEPEETRGLGFDEIRQQQQRIIQEQDAGLDALSSIISRQKQMGQEIGNELDEQNGLEPNLQMGIKAPFQNFTGHPTREPRVLLYGEMGKIQSWSNSFTACEIIDDLANLVENTDERLRTETRRVNVVDRKSTSCGMILVILLLLVAIVVVAVWPTK